MNSTWKKQAALLWKTFLKLSLVSRVCSVLFFPGSGFQNPLLCTIFSPFRFFSAGSKQTVFCDVGEALRFDPAVRAELLDCLPTSMSESKKPDFSGKWETVAMDGLDPFLKWKGIGYAKRKLASNKAFWAQEEIVQTGEKIKITRTYFGATIIQEFTPGDTFEFKEADGSTRKMDSKWDGDKIVTNGHEAPDKPFTMTREKISDTEMRSTTCPGGEAGKGITLVITYKKKA
eukprot:g12098.t1